MLFTKPSKEQPKQQQQPSLINGPQTSGLNVRTGQQQLGPARSNSAQNNNNTLGSNSTSEISTNKSNFTFSSREVNTATFQSYPKTNQMHGAPQNRNNTGANDANRNWSGHELGINGMNRESNNGGFNGTHRESNSGCFNQRPLFNNINRAGK